MAKPKLAVPDIDHDPEEHVTVRGIVLADLDALCQRAARCRALTQEDLACFADLTRLQEVVNNGVSAFRKTMEQRREDKDLPSFEKGALTATFKESSARHPSWMAECMKLGARVAKLLGRRFDGEKFADKIRNGYDEKTTYQFQVVEGA